MSQISLIAKKYFWKIFEFIFQGLSYLAFSIAIPLLTAGWFLALATEYSKDKGEINESTKKILHKVKHH